MSSYLLGLVPHFDVTRGRVYHRSNDELRSSLLSLAQIAEKSERYEDVCRLIKEIIQVASNSEHVDLTRPERQLLWIGYKNVLGNLRSAWRSLRLGLLDSQQQQQIALAQGEPFPEPFFPLVDDYQQQIEKEIQLICSEFIHILENILLKNAQSPETSVFYLKLAGDTYRSLSELYAQRPSLNVNTSGVSGINGLAASLTLTNSQLCDKKASDHYFNGFKLSQSHLPTNHPVRLAISLNYSVHLYENLKDRRSAAELAKAAFDSAIAKLDELDQLEYKDATLVMQLLRDNLTLWSSQEQQFIQQQSMQQANMQR